MASKQFMNKIQDYLALQPMSPKSWKIQTSKRWLNWFNDVARFLPPIEKNIGKEFAWFGVWVLNQNHQTEIEKEWEKVAKEYQIVAGGIDSPLRSIPHPVHLITNVLASFFFILNPPFLISVSDHIQHISHKYKTDCY